MTTTVRVALLIYNYKYQEPNTGKQYSMHHSLSKTCESKTNLQLFNFVSVNPHAKVMDHTYTLEKK